MNDRAVEVSVITVTYNSAEALRSCWRASEIDGAEWIVVDNRSIDDSCGVARSLGAIVIPLPENIGFSAANNVGAAVARGKVLVFCNPDVLVTREGIELLLARTLSMDAIVAPQLLNSDGSPQENGRGAPYPLRKFRHMFVPGHDQRYLRFAPRGTLLPVVWVMGAALAMRREIFETIGGWNSKYFIYYEDSEICLRAARRGIRTYVDGDVLWIHGWGRETAGFSLRAWKFEVRSALRFYVTHPYCIFPLGRRGTALRALDRREVS